MRKPIYAIIMTVLLAVAALMSACNSELPRVRITYVVNGEIYREHEYNENTFKLPAKPANDYFSFEGWYFDADFEHEFKTFDDIDSGLSHITVYAKLTPKQYVFEFIANGNTLSSQYFVNPNEFTFPDEPELTGFDFKGWFLNNTELTNPENIFNLCPIPAEYKFYASFKCRHENLGKPITIEPNCETDGKIYTHCNSCDEEITLQILNATGHNIVTDKAVSPTCTQKGLTRGEHCEYCFKVFIEQTIIDELGHKFDNGVVTTPATCEHTGTLTFSCMREGCGFSYNEEIPSHQIGEWQIIKEGSCVEQGERIRACTICGAVIQRETFAGDGHNLSEIHYDSDKHWQICELCEEVFSSPHSFDGTDCCRECDYYIPDLPANDSILKTIARRIPINYDFVNSSGQSEGNLEMVVIDVAQGDSIFIKFPDGQTMLMDSGSVNFPIGNHYDRVKSILDLYNVKQLDHLFITHSDYDHVRYIEDVLNDYEVKNIYIPKLSDNSNGATWKKVVAAIAQERYTLENGKTSSTPVRYNIGDYEISGLGWRMRCYSYLSKDYPSVSGSSAYSPTAPTADSDEIINSLSPVCLLEYAGRTIVLTGDSNQFNEEYLIKRGVFDGVDADVLKVAHHGSATSTTDGFLAAVHCEYALISYGTNVFGHPTKEVLNRLEANGIRNIFKTKEDGNIRVFVNGDGTLSITTANNRNQAESTYTVALYTISLRSNVTVFCKRDSEYLLLFCLF